MVHEFIPSAEICSSCPRDYSLHTFDDYVSQARDQDKASVVKASLSPKPFAYHEPAISYSFTEQFSASYFLNMMITPCCSEVHSSIVKDRLCFYFSQ